MKRKWPTTVFLRIKKIRLKLFTENNKISATALSTYWKCLFVLFGVGFVWFCQQLNFIFSYQGDSSNFHGLAFFSTFSKLNTFESKKISETTLSFMFSCSSFSSILIWVYGAICGIFLKIGFPLMTFNSVSCLNFCTYFTRKIVHIENH